MRLDLELKKIILAKQELNNTEECQQFIETIISKLCDASKKIGFETTNLEKNHAVFVTILNPSDFDTYGTSLKTTIYDNRSVSNIRLEEMLFLTPQELSTQAVHEYAHIEYATKQFTSKLNELQVRLSQYRNSNNIFIKNGSSFAFNCLSRIQEFYCDVYVSKKTGLVVDYINSLKKIVKFDYLWHHELDPNSVPKSFRLFCLKQILSFTDHPSLLKRVLVLTITNRFKF